MDELGGDIWSCGKCKFSLDGRLLIGEHTTASRLSESRKVEETEIDLFV